MRLRVTVTVRNCDSQQKFSKNTALTVTVRALDEESGDRTGDGVALRRRSLSRRWLFSVFPPLSGPSLKLSDPSDPPSLRDRRTQEDSEEEEQHRQAQPFTSGER